MIKICIPLIVFFFFVNPSVANHAANVEDGQSTPSQQNVTTVGRHQTANRGEKEYNQANAEALDAFQTNWLDNRIPIYKASPEINWYKVMDDRDKSLKENRIKFEQERTQLLEEWKKNAEKNSNKDLRNRTPGGNKFGSQESLDEARREVRKKHSLYDELDKAFHGALKSKLKNYPQKEQLKAKIDSLVTISDKAKYTTKPTNLSMTISTSSSNTISNKISSTSTNT